MLTYERAHELLAYDPETGILKWKVRPHKFSKRRPGDEAGCVYKDTRTSYKKVGIDGRAYPAHRVCWLLHYGEWPANIVDHVNGDGCDNKIVNMRNVTVSQNARNLHKHRAGKPLFATYCKRNKRWKAQVIRNGVFHYLGLHDTAEQASAVGAEFERTGRASWTAKGEVCFTTTL